LGVYGFLAYRRTDRATVEDLTQATFERALRAWSRFDPRRGSERTWLLSIAANLLIDYRRRERSVLVEAIDERWLAPAGGPEERALGSPELALALAELAEREREVLALRFGGDLSSDEIAQLMELTPANVQQITSRALRKLRTLLGPTRAQVTSRREAVPTPMPRRRGRPAPGRPTRAPHRGRP
jgi:RNA polymerase sigma-70 factor, ECF subfamily